MSERLYRLALERAFDGAVVLLDVEGTITGCTPAAAAAFGCDEADLVGRPFRTLFAPEDVARTLPDRELDAARAAGSVRRARWQVRRDGSRFWGTVRTAALREEGQHVGFMTIVRERPGGRLVAASAGTEDARLTHVLETLTQAFCTLDREWRITGLNERAAAYFQRPRDALLGCVIWDVFPDTRGTAFEHHYQRAVREGIPVTFETRSLLSTGLVEVLACPVADGLIVSFREVDAAPATGRAASELQRDLRRRIAEMETLLDVLPIGIGIALDPDARNIRSNRAFARLLRIDQAANASLTAPDRERPTHFTVVRHGRALSGDELPLQVAAREGREVREYEVDVVFADGDRVHMLEYAAPLFDEHGKPRGSIGAFVDVTARVAAEARAEQHRERMVAAERAARAEAERTNRMKDEFLAGLSHELRTPLNAILGWAQLLRLRRGAPDIFEQGLDTLERNGRLLTRLIDDLLDMSRILSGKIRLDLQPVALERICAAAVDAVRPDADAKGIRLQADLDPAVGAMSGDPTRLQQVVWNLLTNAVKFTAPGGDVRVALTRVGAHAEICVADTGIGITPEFLPDVFERFRQADASTTRRFGGLGIGLSIVKQLAELHGGAVRASSEGEGRGATFTVAFPLLPDGAGGDGGGADAAGGRRAGLEDGPPSLAGMTLLLVEDDRDARDLLAMILEDCGARVIAVASAAAALETLRGDLPDVIVSDIGLPDRDGYDLLKEVRALGGPYRSLPAIALTAYARPDDRRRALAAGYQQHLAKPIEPLELCALLGTFTRPGV